MSMQIAVRLPDPLVSELEHLVSEGQYPNKAEAVRVAIRDLIDKEHRLDIARRIVEGYTATPQTDEEVEIATWAATRSIKEEPW